VRPAAGNGSTPLNPNGDGFSSSSTSGFISSDITESEVPYKTVPPSYLEPTGNNNISLNPPGSLANGIYVLQLIAGNEVVFTQRIQKVK